VFEKKTRRRAIRIRQDFRAIDHHRLPRISLRHRHTETLKARTNFGEHVFIKRKPSPKRSGHYFARDVVFSWPESSGSNDYPRTLDRVFNQFFEARIVVADDCFELDVDAQAVELFGEPETVGVGAIRREEFGTDGNDFSGEHDGRLLPQRTRRKKT
jgi:hypothetical protein